MSQRILDVAFQAFHARGYHATSTHDVMHAAGVSSGAFHHHFPTKKSLGLAVVRERVASAIEETWIRPVAGARTALEGILLVFDRVAASLDKRGKVVGCPLNNLVLELSLADPEFRDELRTVFGKWRSAIADKIHADEAGGALRAAAGEDLATFVVASYSGAMTLAKADQSAAPLRACRQKLAQLMRS
jgi:AcrR family transcriptional regulator